MEYGSLLVQQQQQDCNSAYGSLSNLSSDCGSVTTAEADHHIIEELLVQGCWVEVSGVGVREGELQLQQDESSFVVGKRWWIGPAAAVAGSCNSSVKERLVIAVGYLKDYTRNSNVLIQIWVPLRRGILHDHDYHTNYLLSNNPPPQPEAAADHESVSLGFPMPAAPNSNLYSNVHVRFFRSHEYPRVQAQQYGSLALPVFERGTGTCLGVLEIVITNQTTINYNVSNALDQVPSDLLYLITFLLSPPNISVKCGTDYQFNNRSHLQAICIQLMFCRLLILEAARASFHLPSR